MDVGYGIGWPDGVLMVQVPSPLGPEVPYKMYANANVCKYLDTQIPNTNTNTSICSSDSPVCASVLARLDSEGRRFLGGQWSLDLDLALVSRWDRFDQLNCQIAPYDRQARKAKPAFNLTGVDTM